MIIIELNESEYQALQSISIKLGLPIIKRTWVDKHEAAAIVGKSAETLKKLRENGTLVETIHWRRNGKTSISYNAPLLHDWASNQHDPDAHLSAIQKWQKKGRQRISS